MGAGIACCQPCMLMFFAWDVNLPWDVGFRETMSWDRLPQMQIC